MNFFLHLGRTTDSCTSSFWLKRYYSIPCTRISVTGNDNVGFDMNSHGFLLNQWYHIAYTVSDAEGHYILEIIPNGMEIGLRVKLGIWNLINQTYES